MLYGLLITLFVIVCFALILLVLIQKGKGSMGLGTMGGGTQMLFGGSGGQDLFQKITWALGATFMIGSLVLGLMKSSYRYDARYIHTLGLPQKQSGATNQQPVTTSEQTVPQAPAR
jgi:preprotein translocase subunit SecG